MMARRDNTDPAELGIYPELGASRGRPTGASSTTAPRPIPTASRGSRAQAYIEWNGSAGPATTCPTIAPTVAPDEAVGRSS